MPPKKDNIDVSLENMDFTNQKSFLKSLVNQEYDLIEIERDFPRTKKHISTKGVLASIKKSIVSNSNLSKMLSDFSLDNIVKVANNHVESVKNLIRNGKLPDNIQTKDNNRYSEEYKEFVTSNLEDNALNELNGLSLKDKDTILNFNLSEKEIYDSVLNNLETEDVIEHFNSLNAEVFPRYYIKATEHDYNAPMVNHSNVSENALNEKAETGVSDKELASGLKAKNKEGILGETKKESVFAFAKSLKDMNDLLDKRPWYKRWFSSAHKKQKAIVEQAKNALYSRGVSKNSLDAFMKSNGDNVSLENLYNTNKANIEKVNEINKAKLEEAIAKQEDINIKNFFKEQKLSEKAKETLDRANIVVDEEQLEKLDKLEKEKANLEKKAEKLVKGVENSKHTTERKIEYYNELNKVNKQINDLSKQEVEGVFKEENDMDNLEFDASKDILESSDDFQKGLDEEFDVDFEKDVLDALNDTNEEITNDKEIEK